MEVSHNIVDIEKQFFAPLRCRRHSPPTMLLRDRLSHGGKVLIHEEHRDAKALADISHRRCRDLPEGCHRLFFQIGSALNNVRPVPGEKLVA